MWQFKTHSEKKQRWWCLYQKPKRRISTSMTSCCRGRIIIIPINLLHWDISWAALIQCPSALLTFSFQRVGLCHCLWEWVIFSVCTSNKWKLTKIRRYKVKFGFLFLFYHGKGATVSHKVNIQVIFFLSVIRT